jgi:hypothetical protein
VGLPASCQKIQDQIRSLETQIANIQSSPGFIQGHDGPHPGKPDPTLLVEVKALEKQLTLKDSAFTACLLQNVAPFPVTIRVSSIHSIKGTSEIGSDEPYTIVTAVDLSGFAPLVESTLYGPVSMNAGESKATGGPPFWFVDNKTGRTIADLSKVVFAVAMMENDDGSPSAARGIIKAASIASLAGSLNLTRQLRVQKLLADIDSAMGIPTGGPNFDDGIGKPLELVLSKLDLILPVLGPHTVSMTFSGDGQFAVNFLITKA